MQTSIPARYTDAEAALLALASTLFPVVARVFGVMTFVAIPGFRASAIPPRIVFGIGLTIALLPMAAMHSAPITPEQGLWWLAGEAMLGITAGVITAWLQEILATGLQMVSVQAGYSYAATIDPSTEADSGVLPVCGQLTGGLLFFQMGLDRSVLQAFSASLASYPPGTFHLAQADVSAIAAWIGTAFELAVRLALPLGALLLSLDVTLALASRLQAQLQLISLAFPVKMAAALAALAALMASGPHLLRRGAEDMLPLLGRVLGG